MFVLCYFDGKYHYALPFDRLVCDISDEKNVMQQKTYTMMMCSVRIIIRPSSLARIVVCNKKKRLVSFGIIVQIV